MISPYRTGVLQYEPLSLFGVETMGMFDTIIFDHPIPCSKCGAEIRSDQTKAFECTLYEYRIGRARGREEIAASARSQEE